MTKIYDKDKPKSKECERFAKGEALQVHIENLIAHYGEEAIRRMVAIKVNKAEIKAA